MRLSITPDDPLEWAALRAGLVPVPLAHGHLGFILARALLEAVDLGVLEAIGTKRRTLDEVGAATGLHAFALRALLNVLTAADCTAFADGRYALTPMAKKWLLAKSPHYVGDLLVFDARVCWAWMDRLRGFLQTGEGLNYHATFTADEWRLYQRAMLAAALPCADEVGRKTPAPKGATALLDIGGSHGLYSVALCKRHPALHATILDLPAAVAEAAPLLARFGLGDRVRHRAGDALADDLGGPYDLVFMASLAHHFSPEQNAALAHKVARALRPGGVFVVQEFIRPASPDRADLLGSLSDLFYALSSTAGAYSVAEIQSWQRGAGLTPLRPKRLLAIPGTVQVAARRVG